MKLSLNRYLLLVSSTFCVYLPSLFAGLPRADQVWYLHQVSQFSRFSELIEHAPSWNRFYSAGDFQLYRPLLYLQLNFFYFIFNHTYWLWQLASLILHLIVVVCLYQLLIEINNGSHLPPLLLSFLFAVAYSSSELVLWSHISGYITFCILLLTSLLCLVRFIKYGRPCALVSSIILAFASSLTYEIGIVYQILLCIYFIINGKGLFNNRKVYMLLTVSFATFLIVLNRLLNHQSLLSAGLIDSQASANFLSNLQILSSVDWYSIARLSFIQVVYWCLSLIFPAALVFEANDRTDLIGINIYSFPFVLNLFLVLLPTIIFLCNYKLREFVLRSQSLYFLMLLFAYSAVIAYGRSLPNGLQGVLMHNTYYSYIALVIAIPGLYLFVHSFNLLPRSSSAQYCNCSLPSMGITLCFCPLIFLNAVFTFDLSSRFLRKTQPGMLVVSQLKHWLSSNKDLASTKLYFQVEPNCLGDDHRTDFTSIHALKSYKKFWPPHVTLTDVLFPKYSFRINAKDKNLQESNKYVIKCPTQVKN